MNDFLGNFFVVLTIGFYVLCAVCFIGFPISFIVALCQKEPTKRHHYFILSAKLFLLSLLFFVIGFGSCVGIFSLQSGGSWN
ncbi:MULTISPECIES: hypothetical protein [unclassified Moraxella]|uniref:hypothetical protein n=1 Tax=unclassified Moraxella TaxID=2685852 RepID=UPI003AF4C72C